ncbi:MAG: hypothetical protein UY87_C0006G0002 [Candidatus Peribacteria bacterium GW2011_GWC2_54_8]|nr:MAG: hypothetical protein UY87_C0006G0002 [Candidatus Peribacteria bacterium GW2011_GWC2_54_8]
MSRIKLIVIVLLAVAAVQLMLLLGLTLLFYQVTPKSTIIQTTFIGRMQSILAGIRLADHSLDFLYRGSPTPEKLPQYRIDIDAEDLAKLEEEIAQNTDVFIAEDSRFWLPATFTADGETYKVDIRIRGDRFNHWKYQKKSWRVKFQKDHLLQGMRQVSLIIPEDRGWFAEALNSFRARKLGLLQPPMRFVQVSLNGSKPLLYLEVEHWTKEMLEKQGRPGDINFYKTGGVNTSSFDGWDPIFEDMAYWSKFTESVASPHDSYEELAILFSLMEPGAHERPDFEEKVATLFGIDQMVKWYAHSLLAGNLHVGGDNLRLIFDTSRGRFEPIPWDVFLTDPRPLLTLPGNPLWDEVFAVPQWRVAAYRFLWEYLGNEEQVNADLQEAEKLRNLIERAAYRDPQKLPSNRQIKRDLDIRSNQVKANIEFLRNELQRSELLVTQRVPVQSERQQGVGLILDVTTRGPVAAVLSGIVLPLSVTPAEQILLFRDDGNGVLDFADVSVPLGRVKGVAQDSVYFDTRYTLVAPEQPEAGPSGEPLQVPHTHHRFFLKGVTAGAQDLPLTLDLRNAVTEAAANVIHTTVVDPNRLEHSIPGFP